MASFCGTLRCLIHRGLPPHCAITLCHHTDSPWIATTARCCWNRTHVLFHQRGDSPANPISLSVLSLDTRGSCLLSLIREARIFSPNQHHCIMQITNHHGSNKKFGHQSYVAKNARAFVLIPFLVSQGCCILGQTVTCGSWSRIWGGGGFEDIRG